MNLKKILFCIAVLLCGVLLNVSGAYAAMSDEEFIELCRTGSPLDIESAIANGADVNADSRSWKALHYAASKNPNPDVITILIKNGAEISGLERFDGAKLKAAGIDKEEIIRSKASRRSK
jgi:ankyrin repeat protein